jgi:hypothetical protein
MTSPHSTEPKGVGPGTASWIIAKDGKAVCETFDRLNAEYAERNGYEVVPIREWLARVNTLASGDALDDGRGHE